MKSRGRPRKSKGEKTKMFVIRLSADDRKKLEVAAEEKDLTKSDLIREAINFYYKYGSYLD